MKKNFYLLATLFISTLAMFSACSDDDDKGDGPANEEVKTTTVDATAYDKWAYFKFEDKSTVAHEIEPAAGTYTGDLSVTVMGQAYGSVENLKLEVNRLKTDSVSLVLGEFSVANYEIKEITAGATIAAGTHGWDLTGSTIVVNNMNVTPTGYISGDSINLVMTIQPAGMPMPFVATYKATVETRGGVDETSFDWDIALHRYDVKTNGASVLATTETDMAKVTTIPSSGYVADVKTDSIMIDTKGMMQEPAKIGYATGNWNEILNKGIEFDSKVMPPVPTSWTMSGLVYVIKLASGDYAKIKFTDYSNDSDVKGHISFEYVYPFK